MLKAGDYMLKVLPPCVVEVKVSLKTSDGI